jgi:hypothetical protein
MTNDPRYELFRHLQHRYNIHHPNARVPQLPDKFVETVIIAAMELYATQCLEEDEDNVRNLPSTTITVESKKL